MDFASAASGGLAAIFGVPNAVFWAILAIIIGFLILKFIVKSAVTLVKIAILVAIGIGVYLLFQYVVERV